MVWHIPFLPDSENGFVSSPVHNHLRDVTFYSLMVEGENMWDVDVLCDLSHTIDVELIQRISIPMVDKEDSWYWVLDDSGDFTVCNCYRSIQGEWHSEHKVF